MDDAAVLRLIVDRDRSGTASGMRLGAVSPMAQRLLAAGAVDVFAAEMVVDADGRVTRNVGGLADAMAAAWRTATKGNATMGWLVPFADGVSVQYAAIPDGKDVTLVLAPHGSPARPANELVDAMTGLPSRRALLDEIGRRTTAASTDVAGATFAILLVDVDGLHDVNDALGHAAGDSLLCAVAERLSTSVRAGDIVARVGGDEFALLTGSVADESAALGVHLRLLHALSPPISIGDASIRPTVSVGIVLAARGDRTPQSLFDDANLAMRYAQGYGRNHASFYDVDMRQIVTQNFLTAQGISGALTDDELVLYVQPIFTAADLRPVGAEALLRWQHPGRGLLGPGDFMSAIDDANLVLPVGEWVINQVARLAGSWRKHHDLSAYRVGMNLAPSHLMSSNVVATVAAALDRHGANPEHVVVEITESEVLAARPDVLATIEQLRALGVLVAIDDFGAGAAGITYLRDLPVDIVKLHGGLVPADPNERDLVLVSGIVRMCEDLGMTVLLEGVETMPQLDLARECGIALVQGYLLSRPVVAVPGRHLPVPDPALPDPPTGPVEH